MGNAVGGGARVPLGATGTTTFTAPAGMTIADFTLTRQLTYRNGTPADGTRPALRDLQARRHRVRRRGSLRERDAQPPQRRRLLVRLSREQRRRAEEHGQALELPGARGLRRHRHLAADRGRLLQRQRQHRLHGGRRAAASRTCSPARRSSSTTRPLPAASIEASGLLAGGARSGSDAVTLDATDNGGIRRVEILDLTPERRLRRRRGGLRDRRAHRHRRDLLVPPPQGLPEPQERDRAPDRPAGRPADPEGPDHRRRRQRDRAGPVRGRRRHAVGPRAAQRRRRDRGRQADRPLQRHDQDAPHRQLPLADRHLGPAPELLRAADQRRRCCASSRATAARAPAGSSATRRPRSPTAATA